MKIEEQVLSIEQMKHLQELGVDTSDASMVWIKQDSTLLPDNIKELWLVDTYHDSLKPLVEQEDSDFVQTYTIGDLIEKLPAYLKPDGKDFEREIKIGADYTKVSYRSVWDKRHPIEIMEDINEIPPLQLLYKLLCWVAKNHKELIK